MKKSYYIQCLIWCLPLLVGMLDGHSILNQLCLVNSIQAQAPEQDRQQWSRFLKMFSDSTRGESLESRPNITTQFEPLYNFIHSQELLLYDSLLQAGVVDWNDYHNIIEVVYSDTTKLDTSYAVFGWHPYWMGDAYQSYNYELLSHVAFFSYNIDPETGNFNNDTVIGQWLNTALVDSCLAHDVKVYLTITNHTEEGNTTFLRDGRENGSWSTLSKNVIALLDKRKAHGVDINFELVPAGLSKALTEFIKFLSAELGDRDLSVVLPKRNVPWGYRTSRPDQPPKLYEIGKLKDYVDLFILTGYDYHTGDSRTDGPIAPLFNDNSPYSIENSVYAYLEDGIPANKLLLGLPYYGGVWTSQTATPRLNDSTFAFKQHRTYRAIRGRYDGKAKIVHEDEKTLSSFYAYWNDEDSYYEKIWFDDTLTLGLKYDWVLKEKLKGVAIWALGYDNGYPELWELLGEKFSADTVTIYKEPFVEDRVFKLASTLYNYKDVLLMAAIFIVVFLAIGLVVSFFDWRVREVFFSNKTLRLIYLLAGIAIILAVYAVINYLTGYQPPINSWLILGIGLVVGGSLAAIIYRRFDKQRSNLP